MPTNEIREEKKTYICRKGRNKTVLILGDMIVYAENPKDKQDPFWK